MLCKNPFQKGDALYPCGQCMPCRVNRRRVWTHRIMLEGLQHDTSAFVTLTYSDENMPSDGSLRPNDVQDWLKRLRRKMEPQRLRYYLVGEYGDTTHRPHYHAALFGFPTCSWGLTRVGKSRTSCCAACDAVSTTWGFGHIQVGELTLKSAAYIAGYVTKKMTMNDDPRLNGRNPEFARMSLRPGIGGDAMWDMASTLMAFGLDDSQPDVPAGLRHGARVMPLGRYLRRRLRTFVGKEPQAPEATIQEAKAELLPVQEIAWQAPPGLRGATFKSLAVTAGDQKRLQLETKERIYKKRSSI